VRLRDFLLYQDVQLLTASQEYEGLDTVLARFQQWWPKGVNGDMAVQSYEEDDRLDRLTNSRTEFGRRILPLLRHCWKSHSSKQLDLGFILPGQGLGVYNTSPGRGLAGVSYFWSANKFVSQLSWNLRLSLESSPDRTSSARTLSENPSKQALQLLRGIVCLSDLRC
jgi:hypothetical protein